MNFLSLEPFIPSGSNLDLAKEFFEALGFTKTWDAGDYVGFENGNCKFILQRYNNQAFADNLMINVRIPDADAFWKGLVEKQFARQFSVRVNAPADQPYGREVNVVDLAGVCWHFVQSL